VNTSKRIASRIPRRQGQYEKRTTKIKGKKREMYQDMSNIDRSRGLQAPFAPFALVSAIGGIVALSLTALGVVFSSHYNLQERIN
jgi:hypothetical protein